MEWIRGATIGHGSFGRVSLAKPRKIGPESDGAQLMAVKSCGISQSLSLRNEKLILDELKHCPEIIQCHGDCYTLENGEKLYNVLLEYASGGTLYDKMKNSIDHRLLENEVQRYTRGILRGLDYIHKNGYVHCDIKLQNILLNQNGEIKIADFGLAKKADEKTEGNSWCELRGTPMYMSPEMVAGGDQGSPSDIWALGCLVVEMFIGAPVWKFSDLSALLMKIGDGEVAPEITAKLSEWGRDFIGCCFIKEPKSRWTAEMLLGHPFVAADYHSDNFDDAKEVPSTSPRSAFEFSDWVSHQSLFTFSNTALWSPEPSRDSWPCFSGDHGLNLYGGTRLSSPAERLRGLVSDQQPNWSFSDDWITIRCCEYSDNPDSEC